MSIINSNSLTEMTNQNMDMHQYIQEAFSGSIDCPELEGHETSNTFSDEINTDCAY